MTIGITAQPSTGRRTAPGRDEATVYLSRHVDSWSVRLDEAVLLHTDDEAEAYDLACATRAGSLRMLILSGPSVEAAQDFQGAHQSARVVVE